MSVDLDDQLKAYGSWLRKTYNADLTRAQPVSDANRTGIDLGIQADTDRGPERSRHGWVRAAAALLVVAGIGGLIVAQRINAPAPAAAPYTSPSDPPAHLFVLPTETDDLELASGGAYTAQPDRADTQPAVGAGVVIGTEHESGVSNLVFIRMVNIADPNALFVDGSVEVDTSTGPALVDEGAGLGYQQVAQRRGESWLLLTGTAGIEDLINVLDDVAVDSSGSLTVQSGERAIIDEFSHDLTAADYSTYYEATDPASGTRFVIETATSASAVALGAYTPNTITQTTVNGTPAWIMTRDGDPSEGADVAIVWRATPNRVVAVSAHAEPDQIKVMAERIHQVADEEWFTALPEAVTEN